MRGLAKVVVHCVAALAISLVSTLPLAAQDELISIEIMGGITTDESEILANIELELRFTSFFVGEDGAAQQADERVAVTSDLEGRYSIKLNISPKWSNFELRINPARLDEIRYLAPRERLLTELIMSGIESGSFVFEVNWLIESRPGWRELLNRINQHGERSAKGRLLRDFGLPEKEQEFRIDDKVVQIWFYYTQGFAVRFEDEQQDKTFRFRPRRPPK